MSGRKEGGEEWSNFQTPFRDLDDSERDLFAQTLLDCLLQDVLIPDSLGARTFRQGLILCLFEGNLEQDNPDLATTISEMGDVEILLHAFRISSVRQTQSFAEAYDSLKFRAELELSRQNSLDQPVTITYDESDEEYVISKDSTTIIANELEEFLTRRSMIAQRDNIDWNILAKIVETMVRRMAESAEGKLAVTHREIVQMLEAFLRRFKAITKKAHQVARDREIEKKPFAERYKTIFTESFVSFDQHTFLFLWRLFINDDDDVAARSVRVFGHFNFDEQVGTSQPSVQ